MSTLYRLPADVPTDKLIKRTMVIIECLKYMDEDNFPKGLRLNTPSQPDEDYDIVLTELCRRLTSQNPA